MPLRLIGRSVAHKLQNLVNPGGIDPVWLIRTCIARPDSGLARGSSNHLHNVFNDFRETRLAFEHSIRKESEIPIDVTSCG